ncbi:MAG: Peptidoglycan-associated lipoprotein [Syntrophus sp. SKADARSKE-3]|nr:Peptidoglycan-associated lipoprotein [Syntrophus sp. SKADARSKE-3]
MRRIGYGFVLMSIFCIMFTGCASFKPVDLNPQIKSGQLVQKTNNFVVLSDKSASMNESHFKWVSEANPDQMWANVPTRLTHGKDATKNMIATFPEIRMNAGLRTFWADQTTLIYGMKNLDKEEYTKAIDSIENVNGRTPLDKAILAAGNDLKSAEGNSAIIIFSDFSDTAHVDDIRSAAVMEAITKVNADYGDKLCVYAVQIGYTLNGKELSEQIVQNVEGGYTVNADKLLKPVAMAAFVEKVISGNCSRYRQMVAKPKEQVVIVEAEPMADEKVVAAVAETKAEEKTVVLAFEDVHFDFDKSTLKPEAKTILKKNIQMLKDNPKAKIRVAGYTSASGTHAYNQKLSERRASAVQEYLISEGVITRDRLSTIGYGETNPAMYEAAPKEIYSKAAKANMRVLFEVVVE